MSHRDSAFGLPHRKGAIKMRSCKEPPPPRTRPGPRLANLRALVSNHVMEREATIMPVQTNPEIGAADLTAFGEAAKALFSTADTPEEVAAMRDEVLRRIAECAAATRQSIAESERTSHEG